MVRMVLPSAREAGVRQEKTRVPSTSTEQAPHWLSPQPYLAPVRCSSSRNTSSNGRVGSVVTVRRRPFTVKFIVASAFIGFLRVTVVRVPFRRSRVPLIENLRTAPVQGPVGRRDQDARDDAPVASSRPDGSSPWARPGCPPDRALRSWGAGHRVTEKPVSAPGPLKRRPPRDGYPWLTAAQPALSPAQCEVFMKRSLSFMTVFLAIGSISPDLCSAQDGEASTGATRNQEPVVFTTRQDHQNMLVQLGITALRPGRGSNPDSPNPANYDQAKANPYPKLPEILETNDGKKVMTPEQWWKERRPEIVELLEREVYGRIPEDVPRVRWEVRETREIKAGDRPAIRRHIVGVVDTSACPQITVNISMSLTLPKETQGPVPVLMSFGWTPFEPSPFGPRGPGGGLRPPSKEDMLIAAGWGCATLNPSTVQDDSGGLTPGRFGPGADPKAKTNGAGRDRGMMGLTEHDQPRQPDQWEALRAWGAS